MNKFKLIKQNQRQCFNLLNIFTQNTKNILIAHNVTGNEYYLYDGMQKLLTYRTDKFI